MSQDDKTVAAPAISKNITKMSESDKTVIIPDHVKSRGWLAHRGQP